MELDLVSEELGCEPVAVKPVVLDVALQVALGVLTENGTGDGEKVEKAFAQLGPRKAPGYTEQRGEQTLLLPSTTSPPPKCTIL